MGEWLVVNDATVLPPRRARRHRERWGSPWARGRRSEDRSGTPSSSMRPLKARAPWISSGRSA